MNDNPYGIIYCWASRSGDSFSGEYFALFESRDEMYSWIDAMTGSMQERLYVIRDGEIANIGGVFKAICDLIPSKDTEV